MDSSDSSSVSSIVTTEATKFIKEMLKMSAATGPATGRMLFASGGSGSETGTATDTSTVSLPLHLKEALASTSNGSGDGIPERPRQNGDVSNADMLASVNQSSAPTQTIRLLGSDSQNNFAVTGTQVEIVESEASGSTSSTTGSNKVKISPVVNFEWQHKYYIGNLVAVHKDSVHVAYVLKGRSGGVVRLINRRTAQRDLLKGFAGDVADVAFAHTTAVVVGVVDGAGGLYVYDVLDTDDAGIKAQLRLHVRRAEGASLCTHHRLIWCPYISDADDSASTVTTDSGGGGGGGGGELSKLLLLSHNEKAEIWNVDLVMREHGSDPIVSTEVKVGLLTIAVEAHTAPITAAVISPDGSAVATASLDGHVKFYQVDMTETASPRCLHKWVPHDGRPLSCLYFLDDHKHPQSQARFWKFAVTGADGNRELKLWSCESWDCLQSFTLTPPPPGGAPGAPGAPGTPTPPLPRFQTAMDLSSTYLVLSDIHRKVLLVFELCVGDDGDGDVRVACVSEFVLTHPCLSMTVLDAGRRRLRSAATAGGDGDEDDGAIGDMTTGEVDIEEGEEVSLDTDGPGVDVVIKMYTVHERALQDLQIRYRVDWTSGARPPNSTSVSFMSQDGFRDPLSDLSIDTTAPHDASGVAEVAAGVVEVATPGQSDRTSGSEASRRAERSSSSTDHPLLMTPDAFSSPSPKRLDTTAAAGSTTASSVSSFTVVSGLDSDPGHPTPGAAAAPPLSPPEGATPVPSTPSFTAYRTQPQFSEDASPLRVLGRPLSGTAATAMAAASSEFLTSSPATTRVDFVPPADLPTPIATLATPTATLATPTAALATPTAALATPTAALAMPTADAALSVSDVATPVCDRQPSIVELAPPVGESAPLVADAIPPVGDLAQPSGGLVLPTGGVAPPTGGVAPPISRVTSLTGSYVPPTSGLAPPTAVLAPPTGGLATPLSDIALPASSSQSDLDEPPVPPRPQRVIASTEEDEDFCTAARGARRDWPSPPDVNQEAERLATAAIAKATTLHTHECDDEVMSSEDTEEPSDDDGRLERTKGGTARGERGREDGEESSEESDRGRFLLASAYDDGRPRDVRTLVPRATCLLALSGHREKKVEAVEKTVPVDMTVITELQTCVKRLSSLLQWQQTQMTELRAELERQRVATGRLQAALPTAGLEERLAAKLARAATSRSQAEGQHWQKAQSERDAADKRRHEKLVTTVTHAVEKTISSRLEQVIRDELKTSVVPSISKLLGPLGEKLHAEMAQKLTATDALMKENIGKLIRSRQTMEALAQASGIVIEGPIKAACRDLIVPGFERACQSVFSQINQTFQRGTQEYLQNLNASLQQAKRDHDTSQDAVARQLVALAAAAETRDDAARPLAGQLAAAVTTLDGAGDELRRAADTLADRLTDTLTGLEGRIGAETRQIIAAELSDALRRHETTLSDQLLSSLRAATPAGGVAGGGAGGAQSPSPQATQAQVLQLLRQGQLNAAFQQALSASDLGVVMFVCEAVDASHVFEQTPCPLQQAVLLSLIQQLSADLTTGVTVKNKYLEEAVMSLDVTDPVTREHMPSVLGQLCAKLAQHLTLNPVGPHARALRMLLMATKSLLQ